MDKNALLKEWATRIATAATAGMLTRKPITIHQIETVPGPRAGALHILAGLHADVLLGALSKHNCALLRQMIPQEWDFTGDPVVFMHQRYVRVEAGWPDDLAQSDVPLSTISRYPAGRGRWVVGLDEIGRVIVAAVNADQTPHWLISGTTGSGKTWALRSAAVQLAADPTNNLIFVDGKRGASFRYTAARQPYLFQNQTGPVASNADQWRGALVWAVQEMEKRYDRGYDDDNRLIVLVDEVQEVISDPVAAEALRRLAVMGRDAEVHLIAATQHPVVDALGGPTVVRNLGGRLALRVSDDVASRVALGDSTLPAQCLLGKGDAYTKTPDHAYRVQVAYTTDDDARRVQDGGHRLLQKWPAACAEDLGIETRRKGRPSRWPNSTEVGAAIVAAERGIGRDPYIEIVSRVTGQSVGSGRADRTLALGREALEYLDREGWDLQQTHSPHQVEIACAPKIVEAHSPVRPKIPRTPQNMPKTPPQRFF